MVFSPDLGGKNGGVLSMRMQVILDSTFALPGSAPMWGAGRKESLGTGLLRLLYSCKNTSSVSHLFKEPLLHGHPVNVTRCLCPVGDLINGVPLHFHFILFLFFITFIENNSN